MASRRGEAQKRESLDKILNKFGKKDDAEGGVGLERRKSNKDNKEDDNKGEEDEEGDKEDDKEAAGNHGSLKRSRGETSFNNKRMRPNAVNIFRQDVKVKTKLFSGLTFDEKVEDKEGGGRIFTIFPPYARQPYNFVPDLDKEQLDSYRS